MDDKIVNDLPGVDTEKNDQFWDDIAKGKVPEEAKEKPNDLKIEIQDEPGVAIELNVNKDAPDIQIAEEETEEESKYNVWELLQRHEEFKKKGLQLTVDDLYSWICLQDEIIGVVSQMKAEYTEKKLEQDKQKSLRGIELKAEKDENGKTVNTDKMIEQLLKIEFSKDDLDQLVLKNTYELLQQRGSIITDLVNIVKLNMKTDFSI